jgi:hypothetical protein
MSDPWAEFRTPDPWAEFRAPAPAPMAAPSQDPTEQLFVSREAATETRPFGERAAGVATGAGKGALIAGDVATFGLGNRGLAYGRSLGGRLLGEETDYDKKVREQVEYLTQIRRENPERAVAAELTGSVLGPAGLGRAGITLAKPAVGWISRALRGGTEGAALTAAQAAGQSYGTPMEKVEAAAGPATAMGGIFGAGVPLAVSGATGTKALIDAARGVAPQYPPALLRAAEVNRAGLQNLPAMGPDAMLPDVGPAMRRLGQGAATAPGPGGDRLITALTEREAQTIPRMEAGLQRTLGPEPVPADVLGGIKAAKTAMTPEWEAAFQNAKAVNVKPIADDLDAAIINKRGQAQDALIKVREALNIKGTNTLDPHPKTLHETRMMIDDMLEGKDVPSKTKEQLTAARARISEELHANVPDMANLDAKFAEIASRKGAFERGQELFDTGRGQVVRPQEWIAEVAKMGLPKGGPRATLPGPSAAPQYSQMGTRAEIGRVVGTGADDLRALERKFPPHSWAIQNLATQFGANNADEFRHLLTTNRAFRNTYQKIVEGSKTAETLAAAEGAGGFHLPSLSLSGAVDVLNRTLARTGMQGNVAARNRIAEVLAAQGPELAIARQELLNAGSEQARRDITRALIENAMRQGASGMLPRVNPSQERR